MDFYPMTLAKAAVVRAAYEYLQKKIKSHLIIRQRNECYLTRHSFFHCSQQPFSLTKRS